MFWVFTMLIGILPYHAFADTVTATDSRLAGVTFTTDVGLSPVFSPDTFTYTGNVASNVGSISVTPIARDGAVNLLVNGTKVNNATASAPIQLQTGSNIITIVSTALNGTDTKSYIFTINKGSTLFNANLKTLSIGNADLDQAFNSETTYYTGRVKAAASYVVVTPFAEDNATVTVNNITVANGGNQMISLNVGATPITIVVKSYSGATKTYTLQIYRPQPNTNANIKSLTINGASMVVNGTSIVGTIPTGADNVNVTVTTEDPNSKIDIYGTVASSGINQALYVRSNNGNYNQFPITVTATDGITQKSYTLFIVRSDTAPGSTTPSTGSGTPTTTPTVANTVEVANGQINIYDGKGSTSSRKREAAGVRSYSVTLETDAIKKAIDNNAGRIKEVVVDFSKSTSMDDYIVLNIDGPLTQKLKEKKIPLKLKTLVGAVSTDMNLLTDWTSGGSITFGKNISLTPKFGDEYTPASSFLYIKHTGSVSGTVTPFTIEFALSLLSKNDLALNNVYTYDGNTFTFVPSSTGESVKIASGVAAGDYIVMGSNRTFTDIENHWSVSLINLLSKKQVISGYPDNTFKPDRSVTRAEFTSMLVKGLLEKQPVTNTKNEPFSDVNEDDWFYSVVNTGWKLGLVTGTTPELFDPNRNINREEMAAIAVRTFKLLKATTPAPATQIKTTLEKFSDGNQISEWAKGEMTLAIDNKIIEGTGDKQLAPKALATRAEAAAIVFNIIKQTNGF
jgi:hypothetical protein